MTCLQRIKYRLLSRHFILSVVSHECCNCHEQGTRPNLAWRYWIKALIMSPDWQVRWHHRWQRSHSGACWRVVTSRAHTEQLAIVDFLIHLCDGPLLSTILYPCRPSLYGNYRATVVPWTTEKLVWAAVADSHYHTLFCSLHGTVCALLFTLLSAHFLGQFLSKMATIAD